MLELIHISKYIFSILLFTCIIEKTSVKFRSINYYNKRITILSDKNKGRQVWVYGDPVTVATWRLKALAIRGLKYKIVVPMKF